MIAVELDVLRRRLEERDLLRRLLEHRLEQVGVVGRDDERVDLLGEQVLDEVDLLGDVRVGLRGERLFDSPIPGWKPQTAYVGTANKQGGIEMGKYLEKVVQDGPLAIIRGIPGSQVDTDRVDGLNEGVKGSRIKVVKEVAANFDRQQAVGAMEDILQTNPKVSAVFCANDQMALGALQTLAARHLTEKIKLVGFDGAIDATQAMIAKQMYARRSPQDPYGMAQIGIEEAVRAVKHEKVRRNVNTGNPLVTQQNPSAYLKKVEEKLGG